MTEPLDKKIKKLIKEDGFKENCYREIDVKSSLSNLKKRLKEEFEFKDNFRTLNNDKCLLLTEPVFNEIINRLFKEEIGEGLLEEKDGKN